MDKDDLVEKYRDINVYPGWWLDIYEEFSNVCHILGITLDEDEPSFSGFYSQGDGASFTGTYCAQYAPYVGAQRKLPSEEAPAKLREEYPQETELHRIADELCVLSRIYFPVWAKICRHRSNYTHSNTMDCYVEPMDGDVDNWDDEVLLAVDDKVRQLMRDLADWLYARLETDYDYRTSDEAVLESIGANELDKAE